MGGGRERERHLAGGSLVRISHISPPANTHTRHARTRVPQHTHDNYIFRENIAASQNVLHGPESNMSLQNICRQFVRVKTLYYSLLETNFTC